MKPMILCLQALLVTGWVGAAPLRLLDLTLEIAEGRVESARPVAIKTETQGSLGATGFLLSPGFAVTFHARMPAGTIVRAAIHSTKPADLLLRDGRRVYKMRPGRKFHTAAMTLTQPCSRLTFQALRSPVFVGRPTLVFRSPASSTSVTGSARTIILISCDTLRNEALSGYGSLGGRTPHLDRLARRSHLYAQAFSNSPWTLPSHMTLLTGLSPGEHRVNAKRALPAADRTLAERLSDLGFHAAGFASKASWMSPVFGFGRGFRPYILAWDDGEATVDRAADWILRHRDSPSFAFIHLYDAHSDEGMRIYDAPTPYRGTRIAEPQILANRFPGASGSQLLEKADWLLEHSEKDKNEIRRAVPGLRAAYAEGVEALDHAIGRLLRWLASDPVARSATIILTADHGEEFAEHGHLLHNQLYREVTGVPLLVSDGSPPLIVREPVDLTKVAGYIESLASGAPTPVLGGTPPVVGYGPRGLRSLRSGNQMLLYRLGKGAVALYDTSRDPWELRNLLTGSAEVAQTLAARLQAIMQRNDRRYKQATKTRTTTGAPLSDEEIKRLKALGYGSD